jgi:acetyl esterase/lipase
VPVDAEVQTLLDTLEAMEISSLKADSPDEARARFRVLTVDARDPDSVVAVGEVEELTVPGGEGERPARLYRPERDAAQPLPVLVFFHGGGFVIGDLDTHDNQARRLCRDLQALVISVDYRLAPEHPFPAAIDDCLAAYRATIGEVDADVLAVVGESAGGNAVVATLVRARDEGLAMPACAVLLSPWLDLTFSGESMQRNRSSEVMLERPLFESWRDAYVGDADASDPAISPLFADLAGLPPLHVQATTAEVLEDDARRFADRAREAGVDVDLVVHDELWHVFQTMVPLVPEAAGALEQANAFLRAHTRG